jgi:c-di-GMP-binding flagellar brake protein YcgR
VTSEKRREPRFAARVGVRVVRRGETVEYLTNDVSFRGAFVRTDAPPALRQLVKVEFVLPGNTIVSAHAMVVHVESRDPDGEKIPGFGLQFYGPMDREQQKAWERFIYDLRSKERAGAASARFTDKVRRASERFKLALEVVLDGEQLVTRDVSLTGMAVRSEVMMPLGMRAKMQVKAQGQAPVTLDVVVRRHIVEPSFRGLGVEFVDATHEARAALVAFVKRHAPREDAVYIDPDDPGLH